MSINDVPAEVFISIQGVQYGPVDMAQLKVWIHENRVNDQTPCWHQDLPEWMPLGQAFQHLFAQEAAPSPPVPQPPPFPSMMPTEPLPTPYIEPAQVLSQRSGNNRIWIWILLSFLLIALVVTGGFFLIPKLVGGKDVHSVASRCKATALIVDGKDAASSSIDFWSLASSSFIQNEDKTNIVINGSTLTMSSTKQSDLGGGSITESMEIELSSDWNRLLNCKITRKEQTDQYTMETSVEVTNLDNTSEPDSDTLLFSCESLGCKEFLTIIETVTWPNYPDFNQHIEEVFWEKEGLFTLTIEMSQPQPKGEK